MTGGRERARQDEDPDNREGGHKHSAMRLI